VQAAKSVDATEQWALETSNAREGTGRQGANGPEPKWSFAERAILETLRTEGNRMTQEKLLKAAKLRVTGTNKSLLGQMVERAVLDNRRDDRGRGYGLPAWNEQKKR
jgi:hypothetical protein